GNGFDRGVLLQAGISHADAFAAVAHGDNSNIIATRVARETYGVQQVIARIYDTRRAEVYERLGIPTIATVRWTVHRMLNTLSPTDDREVWRDPTSSVAIVEPMLHVAWVGHSLSEWQRHTGAKAAYVTRFGNAMLPTASTVIADGDRVAALVNDDIAEKVRTASARPPADLHGEGEQ
ncbi:MAG: potassium channel family protein, partial [Pseudonocardiaceae bacterium]